MLLIFFFSLFLCSKLVDAYYIILIQVEVPIVIATTVSHLSKLPNSLQMVFEIGREHEYLVNPTAHYDMTTLCIACEIQPSSTLGQVEFFDPHLLPLPITE